MRRTATIGLLGLLMLVIAGACSGAPVTTPGPSDVPASAVTPSPVSSTTSGASDTASAPNAIAPDSPAAGIIVGVDGSASQVKGFTLRTNDGTTIEFVIGQLENADEFPADQLAERQTSAAPILVFFRPVNGQLVVYRMEDAG